ncbi:MAG: ABC transporter substrate-binding protein [Armatimonadota bacterium]|nr:ABC transporter substrate-binding protein [Armatimonadota bacterium]
MKRLGVLSLIVLVALALGQPPAAAQTTRIKLGYLHTLAVDGHIWLGLDRGLWRKHGIEFELVRFNAGPALGLALAGGSVDVGVMGAVISNFPSRGVGKIFLLNNIEHATAVIFSQGGSGIQKVADLKGRRISTTRGTTADVLLYVALTKAGVKYSDVQIVNMDMASAVGAFISGSTEAVSTWWPFDVQIGRSRPNAVKVTQAGNYFPEAAIMGGWVASNAFYQNNRDAMVRIARAWLEANQQLLNDAGNSLLTIHRAGYADLAYDDIRDGYTKIKYFQNGQWAQMYRQGQAARWIGQVERVFMEIGAFPDFVPPERFFDTAIFLEAFKQYTQSGR